MNSNTKEQDLFISRIVKYVDFILDRAYCAWFVDHNYVYISHKFQKLLNVNSNVLDASNFIDVMRSEFSSFMMNIDVQNSRYIEFISDKNVWLSVFFDTKCGAYVIQAFDEYIYCNSISETLDSVSVPIWVHDKDNNMLYCNKKYADNFCKTKVNVIKENLNFFIPKKSAKNNQSVSNVYNIAISGQMKHIEVSEICNKDNIVCVGLDVTDKINNVEMYHNYKNSVEMVLQNISVAIAVFGMDMRLMFVNESARTLFEIGNAQEIHGYHILDLVHIIADKFYIKSGYTTQDIKKYVESVCEFISTTFEPYSIASQLINGISLNIGIYPLKSVGTMIILEDISETISLKQEIKEINQSSLQIIEYLNEGILVFGIDNRIKLINTTTKKIFSKDIEESYIGVHINDFFDFVCNENQECLRTALEIIKIAYQRTPTYGRLPLNANVGIDYRYIPLSDGMHLLKFF